MSVKKKIGIGLGVLVAFAGAYILAIEIWVNKWEQPSKPLPANHLVHEQSLIHDQTRAELASAAQQAMRELATDMQSVSMSGALSIGDELIWSGAIGLQNVDRAEPANVDTLYRIGSVSKALTAVTLMRMVEMGLVDLDSPIQNYLPSYPTYDAPMTARQLASHTAGVRHHKFDITRFPPTDGYSNVRYADVNAALSQFQDDALLFMPGQGYSYSTHGYTLLSAVMEAAGGKPFHQLVHELVLRPAGMQATSAEFLDHQQQDLAGFYTSDGGLFGYTPTVDLSNKLAGGGFVSTPTDLVRMGTALLTGDLLSEASFTEMVTEQKLADGGEHPDAYALGWRHHLTRNILGEDNMVDVIHHGGVSTGSDSFLLLVPDYSISIAITTNGHGDRSRGEIQMLAYQIAAAVIHDSGILITSN